MTLKEQNTVKGLTLGQSQKGIPFGTGTEGLEKVLEVRSPPIRSTSFGNFELCPRYYLLSDRMGLTTQFTISALEVGDLVHQMLHRLVLGHTVSEAIAHGRALLADNLEKLTSSATPMGMLPTLPLRSSSERCMERK